VLAVSRDEFHKQINTLHNKTLIALQPTTFGTG